MSSLPHAGFLTKDDSRHGTVTGYVNWRCRCEACKEAFRAYQREYMKTYRKRQKEKSE